MYGLFFDNTFRSCFNLGKENSGYYFYGADGGYLNYYFIGGATMADVIKNYTYLTGRTPLPQLWTLGYHQSRWGYECAEDIREVAGKFRELSIPCDTIHFDIDYMDGFRVFTWNEKDYGAPGELISELGGQGYKAVTIIDPGVKLDEGYSMYDEGIANDYFAKTPQGDVYDNWVWPGAAVFPDFGKSAVRSWWAGKQSFLTGMGVAGVWNDMNEPASFHGELPWYFLMKISRFLTPPCTIFTATRWRKRPTRVCGMPPEKGLLLSRGPAMPEPRNIRRSGPEIIRVCGRICRWLCRS